MKTFTTMITPSYRPCFPKVIFEYLICVNQTIDPKAIRSVSCNLFTTALTIASRLAYSRQMTVDLRRPLTDCHEICLQVLCGVILDFHAGLPEFWGSNPGGKKEICLCIFTAVIL